MRHAPPAYTNKLYAANGAFEAASSSGAAGGAFPSASAAVELDNQPQTKAMTVTQQAELVLMDANRCHLYRPGVAEELLSAGGAQVQESEVALSLRTRSLPWKRGPTAEGIDEEPDEQEEAFGDLAHKVDYESREDGDAFF